MPKNKLGIICGGTDLPGFVVKEAINNGVEPIVIAIEHEASAELEDLVEEVYWLQVGNIGNAIGIFKENGVKECLMVGRVDHRRIFKNINFDPELEKVYYSLKDHKADSLLGALINVFQQSGIKFINSTEFLSNSLVEEGVIGKVEPSEDVLKEIAFGWELAKQIAGLDIGQSVIVRERAVVGVEAIEGTDELIKRSTQHCPSSAVLVKVAKPEQDLRFDVPVVGPETFENLAEAKAAAVAVEAGKTIIVNREKCIEIADKNKIAFVGVNDSYLKEI